MKRTLVLGLALSVLAANAAFAGSQQESPVINASQTQVLSKTAQSAPWINNRNNSTPPRPVSPKTAPASRSIA